MTIAERDTLTPEQFRECEALLGVLAPELLLAPLYLRGVPADYPETREIAAFAVRGATEISIREMLLANGHWRGPGSVIAFCMAMSDAEALGVVLHEAAHLLPFAPPRQDFIPLRGMKELQRLMVLTQLDKPVGDSPTMPAWYQHHGIKFTRRCLHLHARAWAAGFEIGLPEISFAGGRYDLSPAWRYMRAIGAEPQRMLTESFAEIEAVKPPAEFSQLFADDFAAWCDRNWCATPKDQSHQEIDNVSVSAA